MTNSQLDVPHWIRSRRILENENKNKSRFSSVIARSWHLTFMKRHSPIRPSVTMRLYVYTRSTNKKTIPQKKMMYSSTDMSQTFRLCMRRIFTVTCHNISSKFYWNSWYGSTDTAVETLQFTFSSEHQVVHWILMTNRSNFAQPFTNSSNVSVMNVCCL